MEHTNLTWRKSSYSGGGNDSCVEVAFASRTVVVRDTKAPASGVLVVGLPTWHVFLAKVG